MLGQRNRTSDPPVAGRPTLPPELQPPLCCSIDCTYKVSYMDRIQEMFTWNNLVIPPCVSNKCAHKRQGKKHIFSLLPRVVEVSAVEMSAPSLDCNGTRSALSLWSLKQQKKPQQQYKIMTRLLKIIHRTCCEQFLGGNSFFLPV